MKNLRFFLIIQILLMYMGIQAQSRSIEWQKCIGGSNDDNASCIIQTSDGGYLSVGHTTSNDYDATDNHSNSTDWFVVKLSVNGNIEWTKCLGGTGGEYYPFVLETTQGGYIIVGSTGSSDGDVSGHHGSDSVLNYDAWVVKINQMGDIIWQKCYGGSEDDDGTAITQTPDGGYLFVGQTFSNDGDLQSINISPYKMGWIVKIDSIGNIEWQKLVGGTDYDNLLKVSLSSDNGYIIAGTATSNDGDVQGNIWVECAWIIKLNSIGIIQWQKCIGRDNFNTPKDIIQCSDGGYIVACDNNHLYAEDRDGFIVKLSSTGAIQWQKDLGGDRDDFLSSLLETPDGGFIVGGTVRSYSGDIPLPSYGFEDCWIVKLSSSGNIVWQRRFGGNSDDLLYSLKQTSDLGYIFAGKTRSNNQDVSGLHQSLSNYVYSDMWIVKLSPNVFVDQYNVEEIPNIYPNPTSSILYILVDSEFLNEQFEISNILGQIVFTDKIVSEYILLDVSHLTKGVYVIKIGQSKRSNKFVVN